MSFANKVVLVIGASSGIGAATAVAFTKEEANVVMVGRNTNKLKDVAEQCEKHGKSPLVIKADISKDDEAIAAINKTINKFDKLDILINNAGLASFGTILEGTLLKSYDETLQTNLRGLIHLTQLAAPHLVKTKGSIINISSIAGSSAPVASMFTAYGVSKAGLNHFTKCAAFELAPHCVRVNAISPGPVLTDFAENNPFKVSDDFKFSIPLNRVSDSSEIADLILFLSSEKARGITGSIYISDNGCSLAN